MSCKTETAQIGDYEFSVTQWPAQKALLMKMRLMKTVGPALARLMDLMKERDDSEEGVNFESMSSSVSEAVGILFDSGSPEEITDLMKEFVLGCAIHNHPEIKDGSRITSSQFDQIFSGDELYRVYQVFFFVVRVNYLGFIKGQYADRILAKVREKMGDLTDSEQSSKDTPR